MALTQRAKKGIILRAFLPKSPKTLIRTKARKPPETSPLLIPRLVRHLRFSDPKIINPKTLSCRVLKARPMTELTAAAQGAAGGGGEAGEV
jgi:hypothetical protein